VSGYSHVTGSLTVSNSDVPVTVSLWGTTYNAVFTVNDGTNPISGANVYFNGSAYITDSNGQIFISKVANGSYVYLVSSSGYADATGNLKINSANNSKTISLNKVNYSVTFTVTDGTIPVSGASITIDGATYTTSPKGQVFITNIANGTFSYTITASAYNNYPGTITIGDADILQTITLTSIATGDKEATMGNILVYPNPASERLMIEVPSTADVKTIGLFNIAGQKLYEATGCRNKVTVDLSTVPAGILVVKLIYENGNIVIQKVVHNQ
jgi:hypothetical protein